MKIKIALFAVIIGLVGCADEEKTSSTNTKKITSNQTMYYGGSILTMDGSTANYAEAVVTENGKIVFVGSQNDANQNYADANKINLDGKTMLPGFLDPHSHFMSAVIMVNQVNVAAPPVGTATSIPEIMELMQQFKTEKNIQDGEWIVAWGYDQDLIQEKRHITKLDIDKYFPNNKVLIIHVSMHGAILNSQALEWAEIDANTETPEGGVIARLPNSNEPAGLLMEMAYIPVFGKLPQPTDEEMMELITPAQMMYASNGYTQAVEGFTHVKHMDYLKKAAANNHLFIDLISLPGFTEMDQWLNNSEYEFGVYNQHLKFGGGKFTLDGSPQGRTAYMGTPYLQGGPNGEKNWVGNTSIPREELARMAKVMVENNVQINFHANGDAAIDDAIYAIENAGITAADDKRPIIIHSQFQRPEQLDKYAELGISPTYFTNHTFFWGDVHIGNVGMEKASFISPIKAANQKSIVTSNHTDFNVTPLDPFFVMWTSMKRETRNGVILGEDQVIDAYAAIQNLTTGPAFQFFEEGRKGKIKVGLLADFVILDTDPLKVTDVDLIKNIQVLETIKEGETIFKK